MKPNDYDLQPVDSYDEYEEIQPAESNNTEKKEKKEQPDKLLAVTNSIDQVCQTVNSATTTVAEAVKSIADVRLQIETMDHELSMFIVESQKNLEKFQQFAPMLEKQLENASAESTASPTRFSPNLRHRSRPSRFRNSKCWRRFSRRPTTSSTTCSLK